MSGVEVVVAAAAVSLLAGGVSTYEQINEANKEAELQNQNIREQQVQLRLQQNQQSIERMKKLQAVLATEEVTLGERNITPGSGTSNAFTINAMSNFYEDEDADKLNYGAKQVALVRQRELVYDQRRAQVVNAVSGFVRQGAGAVMAAYGVPSQSLMDQSTGGAGASSGSSSAGTGTEGSVGYQQWARDNQNQFNLNA